MRPSAVSVAQILMSAACTGPAASPVPTPTAATPAPAWKDICLSQTIAPARPRTVRSCTHQHHPAHTLTGLVTLRCVTAHCEALETVMSMLESSITVANFQNTSVLAHFFFECRRFSQTFNASEWCFVGEKHMQNAPTGDEIH